MQSASAAGPLRLPCGAEGWNPHLHLTPGAESFTQLATMASLTQITKKRRRRKRAAVGRDKKRARTKASTPKFPIIPE